MNEKEARYLITRLIDAAYDSGYYSGKKEDGSAPYMKAIALRNDLRDEVIDHLTNSIPLLGRRKSMKPGSQT